MDFDRIVLLLVRVVEVGGVAILVAGSALATVAFVRDWLRVDLGEAYAAYRANLGRAILLGLEFLVVADIIATVAMEPTFHNLGILSLLVLVRTFLSFALEVEISGTLPWKRGAEELAHEPGPDR